MTTMHAHDGYEPHSHEVRADHKGVGREQRPGVTLPAPVLPELDRECPGCNGAGYAIGSPAPVRCAACRGNGYVLTDAGREVLRFLQRHPPNLTRTT